MVEWAPVLAGLAGFAPAILVLLVSYGPYEGHFKDNVLFLFFMGGVFGGMGMAILEMLFALPRDALYLTAMVLLGFPLLEQALKLVVLNRRKFQGERTTTFYGGAFGLGFASMGVFFLAQQRISLLPYRDLATLPGNPGPLVYLLTLGMALLLAHFAAGVIVGDGVRTRKLVPALLLSVVALVPVQFFIFEFTAGLLRGRASEGFIYLPLALGYGVALAWWAHTKLLPKALPPEAQRKRRRVLRRAQREG